MRWIGIFFLLAMTPAWAADTVGTTKIDTVLQALLDYLTSTPARLLAVLSIVGVGYATLYLGRMPKQRAVAVVVGIGIIFGAAALSQMLGLGGA